MSARPVRRAPRWTAPKARARSGVTLIEMLVVMSILAILAGAIASVALRAGGEPRKKKTIADISKLELAIDAYKAALREYPPDTGYGLKMVGTRPSYSKQVGEKLVLVPTYDPGSLWRYLVRRIYCPRMKKWYGPFLEEWTQEQLMPYEHTDTSGGMVDSFYLADPWGNPYSFIGNRKRVVHNAGSFDIFSAGPDGVTACNNDITGEHSDGNGRDSPSDNPQSEDPADNRAYNTKSSGASGGSSEYDDDGNGIANDVAEFSNNGASEAILNGDVGDDINNWSAH